MIANRLFVAAALLLGAALAVDKPPQLVGSFNCEVCTDLVGKVFSYAGGNKTCPQIEADADVLCDKVPPSVVGPYLCNFVIKHFCPKVLAWIDAGSSATDVCERIGFCAGPDSECHSFGKESDNGKCTAALANTSSTEWRLEWNALPWWKNKGCVPPRHIGLHKEFCSESNIGCCLSGWTPRAVVETNQLRK